MYNFDYLKQKCHQRRIEIVIGMVRKYLKDSNILSVGCGPGYIEKDFPAIVEGVDKIVPEKTFIPVKEGELQNIPFEDSVFDGVFLGEVFEHAYDTRRALSEIARVLKDKGILIITVPNVMNLRDRFRALFGALPRHLSGYLTEDPHLFEHIRHFNKRSLRELLTKNGFEVLKFTSPAININLFGSKPIDLYFAASLFPSLGNNLICVSRLKKCNPNS